MAKIGEVGDCPGCIKPIRFSYRGPMPEPAYFVCLNCGTVLTLAKKGEKIRSMSLYEQMNLKDEWSGAIHNIWLNWNNARKIHIDNYYDKAEAAAKAKKNEK